MRRKTNRGVGGGGGDGGGGGETGEERKRRLQLEAKKGLKSNKLRS